MPSPLSSRPLDYFYVAFFAVHIVASALMDFQMLFPNFWSFFPPIQTFPQQYIDMSSDPLVAAVVYGQRGMVWFKTFLWIELLFQFPVFFLGIYTLKNDHRWIYPVLLAYGASTATTTLPCLTVIVDAAFSGRISSSQYALLLGSYTPYFLVPLGIAVDMAFRLGKTLAARAKTE